MEPFYGRSHNQSAKFSFGRVFPLMAGAMALGWQQRTVCFSHKERNYGLGSLSAHIRLVEVENLDKNLK